MIYKITTSTDGSICEKYEGTPEEILELKNIKIEENIIRDYQLDEEGINLLKRTGTVKIDKPVKIESEYDNTLDEILNLLKYYMKKIGIVYKEEK